MRDARSSWMPGSVLVLMLLGAFGFTVAAATPTGDAADSEAAANLTKRRGQAYAHLMRALFAVRQGDFGDAARDIDQALELDPDSPDLLIESADLLQWTGRRDKAEDLARRALEIDSEHLDTLRFLADLAATRALSAGNDDKSRDEALGFYGRLAELDEDVDPDVLRMLATLRIEAKDVEGAIDVSRRLVASRPGDVRATHTLAQLLLRSGEDREALEVLLRYVSGHPYQEEMLGFAVQLTRSVGDWGLAREILTEGAPYGTDMTAIHRFYGEVLLRTGSMDEAADTLERALAERPDDSRVRKDLALAYHGMGRLADAADLLRGLAREFPEFPFYYELLGDTLANQGDSDAALVAYRAAVHGMGRDQELASHRDGVRMDMAALHLDAERLEDARWMLGELEDRETPDGLHLRARVAMAEENWKEVAGIAAELRERGRNGLAALLEGEAAVTEGRWSRAKGRFEEVVRVLGQPSRRTVADVYRRAGRVEQGEALLREWVALEPGLADAHYWLGVYLYQVENFDGAEAGLREAFRLNPRHAPALNFLGYSLAERKRQLDAALAMVQRALEVDSWNGAYLDSLGWVYFQMGRFEDARGPLERAARELPNDATVLEHLGDLYFELGERTRALSAWNRALLAGAEDAEALRGKIAEETASAEPGRTRDGDADLGGTGLPRR